MVLTPSAFNDLIRASAPVITSLLIFIQLIYDSYSTLVCRTYALGISAQSLAYYTVTCNRLLWARCQFFVRQFYIDGAVWNIYLYDVSVLDLDRKSTRLNSS